MLFAFTSLQAQQSSISGKVTDAENKAVEYANVLLVKSADSSLVKGVLTEGAGTYTFEGLSAGKYKVIANMLGLGKAGSPEVSITGSNEVIRLEPLVLRQASHNLQEVVIEGQRPLIEQQFDKTILNVDNSIVSAGNTALEVLEKAPGIVVDQNDNISMRGRPGVMVMIDGKQVQMSGTELANMLRGMSANSVDKIELITNPSSKYDAAGNAGIINIKLKRDKSQGTNGTYTASFGQGRYGKADQGIQVNHRAGKFNLFGGYNYSYRKSFTDLDIYREFFEQGEYVGAYDQQNSFNFTSNYHTARLGLDYYLSPKTVVGVIANGFMSDLDRDNANRSVVLNGQRQPESLFLTEAVVGHGRNNGALNFNLKHSLDSLGREVTADIDYVTYQNEDIQDFTTRFYNLDNEQLRMPYLLHGNLDGELTIKSAKVDYVQPLQAIGASLEAGVKSSLVNADNDLAFYDRSNGGNVLDEDKSNHFMYEENINAAYLNTSKKWENLSLQLGLRVENTIAKGEQLANEQLGEESRFDRKYTQLFPSAFVGYSLNEKHELGVSLSRRINRPSYNQLNPFKNFLDPSTYAAGNPFLKPELSYSFELTHTLDKRIVTKLSYSHTSDVILNVLSPDPDQEKLVMQTFRNLTTQDYYGLTVTVPFSVGSWFNSINNGTFYYSLYQGNVADTELNSGRPTFTLNSNNTLTLTKGWSAEVVGVYRSREIYGFLDVNPICFLSGGVQKQLWDKKVNLKLNVTDAFFTNKVRATTVLTGYSEDFYQRRDSRVVTLSFAYKFGRSQAAPSRRRTGGAEEEKSRAN